MRRLLCLCAVLLFLARWVALAGGGSGSVFRRLCRGVEVVGKAVITSGEYQRFFEEDGKTYHHIIDPATGLSC